MKCVILPVEVFFPLIILKVKKRTNQLKISKQKLKYEKNYTWNKSFIECCIR